MDVYSPLVLIGLMSLCIAGFHGGLLYSVRFLRREGLIDTGVIRFIAATLFGDVGSGYKLFYRAYSDVRGHTRARLVLCIHFGCLVGFVALPFLFY